MTLVSRATARQSALVVELRAGLGNGNRAEQIHHFLGRLGDAEGFLRAAAKPRVVVGSDQGRIGTTVTGDNYRLGPSECPEPKELAGDFPP
jgi:hypothetical protein